MNAVERLKKNLEWLNNDIEAQISFLNDAEERRTRCEEALNSSKEELKSHMLAISVLESQ